MLRNQHDLSNKQKATFVDVANKLHRTAPHRGVGPGLPGKAKSVRIASKDV